jgi:hypothetical protein
MVSAMYREGMLTDKPAASWLLSNNVSKYSSITVSDQTWIVEVLYLLLAQNSLRRMAVVVPEDVFLQMVSERLLSLGETCFQVWLLAEA